MRTLLAAVPVAILLTSPSTQANSEFGFLADGRFQDVSYREQGFDKHALKLGEANDVGRNEVLTAGGQWQYSWLDEWRVKVSALADNLEDGDPGLIEAFVGYQPIPDDAWRSQFRTGMFFAPFTMENTERFWQDRYGLTPSAITSWFGEELRTFGAEYQLDYRGEVEEKPWRLGLTAAVFQGNDPAGSLLAWRGFGLHSRISRWNESIDLPLLPAFSDAGPFPKQSQEVNPFEEIDHRVGWYVGGRFEFERSSQIQLWHYDNRGDPTSFRDGQYSWDTRFDLLSIRQTFASDWEVLAQWLRGESFMGAAPTSVDIAFIAQYVMINRRFDNQSVSLRIEHFKVDDNDLTALDNNDEKGRAITLAWLWHFAERWRLGAEWLRVSAKRPALATVDIPTEPDDHQVSLSIRYIF
ncbi:hypothetical protein HPT27_12540 [Permianibacter sp. IMCC34836]|uniref:hypothetical protein n=1 Tax=Permianibacter fluminis TaxID=2738515 RepID=UPI00155167C3|nr:hypothetical protein [Permianibacter fluminis]NQD37856.1 hypothetical protein [Permianibacter fluminis]